MSITFFSTCVGTNLQIVYFDIHLRRSSFLIGGNTSITKNLKTAELSTELHGKFFKVVVFVFETFPCEAEDTTGYIIECT
jgi:hypothetical protein